MSVRLAGIDGCRNAWLVVTNGGLATQIVSSDDELIALFRQCDVVAIDIPIGLAEEEGRACDRAAREKLGRRWMCVFPAPLRSLLGLEDYAEANRIAKSRGKGISKQGFMLYEKVAQIDRILQRHPELRDRVYEVHPEVSFAEWAGSPLPVSKHKREGRAMRRALAVAHFQNIPPTLRGAKEDDLLDALAALRTAERIHNRQAHELGDGRSDAAGLPMRIVY